MTIKEMEDNQLKRSTEKAEGCLRAINYGIQLGQWNRAKELLPNAIKAAESGMDISDSEKKYKNAIYWLILRDCMTAIQEGIE